MYGMEVVVVSGSWSLARQFVDIYKRVCCQVGRAWLLTLFCLDTRLSGYDFHDDYCYFLLLLLLFT